MLISDMIALITKHLFPQKPTSIILREFRSFIYTVNRIVSGKIYTAGKNFTLLTTAGSASDGRDKYHLSKVSWVSCAFWNLMVLNGIQFIRVVQ